MANTTQIAATEAIFEDINQHLGHDLLRALLATTGGFFAYRIIQSCQRRSRLVACLNKDALRYFSVPSKWWCGAKYHLLYAPSLMSRHNGSCVLGQLPTRTQALLLIAIVAVNATLCFYNVPYRDPNFEVLAILRSRTGTIAVTNLIPIVIMASVKNPLINILNVSYDSFNFLHRWFGRIAIAEAAVHTGCHISSAVQRGGWHFFIESTSNWIILTGLVAMSAFVAILMQSPSILRRAFYESFLHTHIALAILVLVFLWWHLEYFPVQRHLLLTSMVLWGSSRVLRLSTLAYRSLGRTSCAAVVEVLPRETMRITINPSHPWRYQPGQYIYLTIPSIGLWTAHPFSIAWSDTVNIPLSQQSSIISQTTIQDVEKANGSSSQTFSLLVRAQDGFTKRLLNHTIKHAPRQLSHRVHLSCLIEGPYGLSRSMDSYGTVLLIAGGVGITHHLGYLRHLIQGFSDRVVATRHVTLIWVVKKRDEKHGVSRWIDDILRIEDRREVCQIEIWVTKGAIFASTSPSETIFVRRGRPDLASIVRREADRREGCMGVSVCGPGGLMDDTRRAVRQEIGRGKNIEFVEEPFGW